MSNEKRLIDANALMYLVLNHPRPYRRDFYAMLNNAPTVDAVEVVHGHWIEHPNTEMHNGKWVSNYECSECFCFYRTHENYCGYCGAKMDLE